jgi:transcriptional regulator with XRE-family HTH domain
LDSIIAKLQDDPSLFRMRVGQNIASEREAAGKSLPDVANAAGLGPSELASIEAGDKRPTGGELVAIAQVLGVPLDRFFNEI